MFYIEKYLTCFIECVILLSDMFWLHSYSAHFKSGYKFPFYDVDPDERTLEFIILLVILQDVRISHMQNMNISFGIIDLIYEAIAVQMNKIYVCNRMHTKYH